MSWSQVEKCKSHRATAANRVCLHSVRLQDVANVMCNLYREPIWGYKSGFQAYKPCIKSQLVVALPPSHFSSVNVYVLYVTMLVLGTISSCFDVIILINMSERVSFFSALCRRSRTSAVAFSIRLGDRELS